MTVAWMRRVKTDLWNWFGVTAWEATRSGSTANVWVLYTCLWPVIYYNSHWQRCTIWTDTNDLNWFIFNLFNMLKPNLWRFVTLEDCFLHWYFLGLLQMCPLSFELLFNGISGACTFPIIKLAPCSYSSLCLVIPEKDGLFRLLWSIS